MRNPISIQRERWIVKNGLLIPLNAVQQKSNIPNLNRDVIAYISFEELFPSEKNTELIIQEEFNQFWLRDIVQVLAKIHYAASPFYHRQSLEDYKIIAAFLNPQQNKFLLDQREVRKSISRQQLLANLRLAFIYAPDDPGKLKVLGHEKEFGKLVYRITDLMEEPKTYDTTGLSLPESKKKLSLSMARNIAFNESETFARAFTRYWYIFNRIAYKKKHRDFKLKGRFKKATGTDFNHMAAVGFASWAFYSKPEREKRLAQPHEFIFNRNYFKNTNANTRRKLLQALKTLSGDWGYFKAEFSKQGKGTGQHFSFYPFWRKPILQQEKEAFYILDSQYLEERLSMGAFWFIYDEAIKQGTADYVKGRWGNIFEDYVEFLVKETFAKNPAKVFSFIDSHQEGSVDLIICYPDTIFLIEITTKQVALKSWLECNEAEIEDYLKRILIKDNRNSGKAASLYKSIEKIKKGEIKLEGVNITKIKKFIPVILFEKAPPMYNRLWPFYQDFLERNGITDRGFLDELEFWDIEELEIILADILKDKSLSDIMKEREDSGFYKDSVKNFYILGRKHIDKHPALGEAFTKMTDQHKKMLFKKKNRELSGEN